MVERSDTTGLRPTNARASRRDARGAWGGTIISVSDLSDWSDKSDLSDREPEAWSRPHPRGAAGRADAQRRQAAAVHGGRHGGIDYPLTLRPAGRHGKGVIAELSPHLFWDVNPRGIDPERHAAWLARRVLEYGRWQDWGKLVAFYGKPRLAEIVTTLRSLDPKAFSFCRAWFDLPASAFRCFTTTPFHPTSPVS